MIWLLTSGPTREYLDDVRYLSNASSGRMGFELAKAAAARGYGVVVVSGPVPLVDPPGVRVERVTSAADMLAAARQLLAELRPDVVVGVAAVCDYRPRLRRAGKPPKGTGSHRLDLVENPDVISTLAEMGVARCHVGFALEVLGEDDPGLAAALARARAKAARKRLDAIVLNGLATLEADQSRAWWVPRGATAAEALGYLDKPTLARILVDRIERLLGASAP